MPRPPRLEYANALYHVASRGARRSAIFQDDDDRASLLAILAHVGSTPSPSWLASRELLGVLTGLAAGDTAQTAASGQRYAEWVEAGREVRLWQQSLRQDRFLGDQTFVERVMRAVQ